MRKPIKMRRRDIAIAVAPPPPEVVRLEKVVERVAATDLSPLEKQLREQKSEIREIKKILSTTPKKNTGKPENYRFVVHRGPDRLIDYVDGVVLSDTPTLLQGTSGKYKHFN